MSILKKMITNFIYDTLKAEVFNSLPEEKKLVILIAFVFIALFIYIGEQNNQLGN